MNSITEARDYRQKWAERNAAFLHVLFDRMDTVQDLQQRLIADPNCIAGLSEDEGLGLLAALGVVLTYLEVLRGEVETGHRSSEMN